MEVPKIQNSYFVIYIISAIVIYLFLILRQKLNNPIVFAVLIALTIPILVYFINLPSKKPLGSGLSRYTMKCNSCHWEWMSNITEKTPDKCPKCHKDNLEVVGWRKVEAKQAKSNKDLKEFFK